MKLVSKTFLVLISKFVALTQEEKMQLLIASTALVPGPWGPGPWPPVPSVLYTSSGIHALSFITAEVK